VNIHKGMPIFAQMLKSLGIGAMLNAQMKNHRTDRKVGHIWLETRELADVDHCLRSKPIC
jgi:hypothetical protein